MDADAQPSAVSEEAPPTQKGRSFWSFKNRGQDVQRDDSSDCAVNSEAEAEGQSIEEVGYNPVDEIVFSKRNHVVEGEPPIDYDDGQHTSQPEEKSCVMEKSAPLSDNSEKSEVTHEESNTASKSSEQKMQPNQMPTNELSPSKMKGASNISFESSGAKSTKDAVNVAMKATPASPKDTPKNYVSAIRNGIQSTPKKAYVEAPSDASIHSPPKSKSPTKSKKKRNKTKAPSSPAKKSEKQKQESDEVRSVPLETFGRELEDSHSPIKVQAKALAPELPFEDSRESEAQSDTVMEPRGQSNVTVSEQEEPMEQEDLDLHRIEQSQSAKCIEDPPDGDPDAPTTPRVSALNDSEIWPIEGDENEDQALSQSPSTHKRSRWPFRRKKKYKGLDGDDNPLLDSVEDEGAPEEHEETSDHLVMDPVITVERVKPEIDPETFDFADFHNQLALASQPDALPATVEPGEDPEFVHFNSPFFDESAENFGRSDASSQLPPAEPSADNAAPDATSRQSKAMSEPEDVNTDVDTLHKEQLDETQHAAKVSPDQNDALRAESFKDDSPEKTAFSEKKSPKRSKPKTSVASPESKSPKDGERENNVQQPESKSPKRSKPKKAPSPPDDDAVAKSPKRSKPKKDSGKSKKDPSPPTDVSPKRKAKKKKKSKPAKENVEPIDAPYDELDDFDYVPSGLFDRDSRPYDMMFAEDRLKEDDPSTAHCHSSSYPDINRTHLREAFHRPRWMAKKQHPKAESTASPRNAPAKEDTTTSMPPIFFLEWYEPEESEDPDQAEAQVDDDFCPMEHDDISRIDIIDNSDPEQCDAAIADEPLEKERQSKEEPEPVMAQISRFFEETKDEKCPEEADQDSVAVSDDGQFDNVLGKWMERQEKVGNRSPKLFVAPKLEEMSVFEKPAVAPSDIESVQDLVEVIEEEQLGEYNDAVVDDAVSEYEEVSVSSEDESFEEIIEEYVVEESDDEEGQAVEEFTRAPAVMHSSAGYEKELEKNHGIAQPHVIKDRPSPKPVAKASPVVLTDERRKKCYMWFSRLGQPTKSVMKKRVAAMQKESNGVCDITPEEVDALPWVGGGLTLNVRAMNELFLNPEDAD